MWPAIFIAVVAVLAIISIRLGPQRQRSFGERSLGFAFPLVLLVLALPAVPLLVFFGGFALQDAARQAGEPAPQPSSATEASFRYNLHITVQNDGGLVRSDATQAITLARAAWRPGVAVAEQDWQLSGDPLVLTAGTTRYVTDTGRDYARHIAKVCLSGAGHGDFNAIVRVIDRVTACPPDDIRRFMGVAGEDPARRFDTGGPWLLAGGQQIAKFDIRRVGQP